MTPRPVENRESAFARFAERYSAAKGEPAPTAFAQAAARNDLILEDDEAPRLPRAAAATAARLSPAAAARMERLQALARPRPAAKPDARLDDDLFEAPRRAAGGQR